MKVQKIRSQILKYISKKKAFNIGSRELAIKKAIKNAEPKEIILVAGKGHEAQQIYKNRIINISDKQIIRKIKIKPKIVNRIKENYSQNKLILSKILGKVKSINFNGLSIDSRTIKKGNLFLAIKGNKNNGHKFIKEAFRKGAGCVVSAQTYDKKHKKIFKVKNSISFLNHFANLKRDFTSAKIIAVTGSAGKTSLKNLLKDLLQNFGRTHFSPKSYNNHLGVPISLSNLSSDDRFGVFEVGMNRPGEIRNLTRKIKPHIGVITNIGEAHLENFKNINGIAKAKSEIMENIKLRGTIILNRDDIFFNYLSQKALSLKLKILTFGKHKKSHIRLKKIEKRGKLSVMHIEFNNQILRLKIRDLNVYNVLSSIAVLKELKVNILKIKDKFKNFDLPEGRGKKHTIKRYNKKFNLIDESYNANPLSVKNAIIRLGLIKKDKFKKYLILGDMLELGSKSNKYHEELSKVINNSDIDKVFIKGKNNFP